MARGRALFDAIRRLLAGRELRAREAAAEDLLAISRLLASQPRLRMAFTDPALSEEAKRGLARAVFGPTVSDEAMDAFVELVGQRLTAGAVANAVDEVAAQTLMDVADDAGTLEDVEDQLVGFARLVERDHALRSALTDPALPSDGKRALIADLLAGRADPRAATLVDHWVARERARELPRLVDETIAEAAARRERAVAQVTSAVPLDDGQRDRLAAAMERVTGLPVDLQVEVDPSVVGSLSVRVGDQVYDGTVKRQLELLGERLGA